MVQLEDVASAAPRARGHSVASLCICSVQWAERDREAVHSAAEPSVKEYKTAFPSTCHLGQFGDKIWA